MTRLSTPITALKGVGEKLAERLAKLKLHTIEDLLLHLPHRYLDKTRIYPIASVHTGQFVVIEGTITKKSVIPKPKRNLLLHIQDATGKLAVRFFHFHPQQADQLKEGCKIRCAGEVRLTRQGLQMIHPEYRLVTSDMMPVDEHLTPIYPTTEGVGQAMLRKLTDQALEQLKFANIPELLPEQIRHSYHLTDLKQAIADIHRPGPENQTLILEQREHPAQLRLAFEELLAHHLLLRHARNQYTRANAYLIEMQQSVVDNFKQQLPFQLTNAQQKALQAIFTDLTSNKPMMRLVQGDVGSGKTIVAALATLLVVKNGFQVAIMAPTEILAEQHYQSFQRWFSPFCIKVGLFKSQLKQSEKKQLQTQLAAGEIDIAIGTHALFQEQIKFKQLAMVVIDEQHRFGVAQRLRLHDKGKERSHAPHQLVMTATPIPRTLAMTCYADLDTTVIDELPPGRQKINTLAISQTRRSEVIEKIKQQCQQGRQVYWVCTLIEESETLQCQAAEDVAIDLKQLMPEVKIGLVHGRMKTSEKEQIMQQFHSTEIDLLVATTVIEVGVDVPNASLMVIENPERLGLSQLHQLRGRVGRGSIASHCILLYQDPLSEKAQTRLDIMRQSQDGFWIAEQDLQIRGPGEILGTKQTGLMDFRVARWQQIQPMIEKLETTAKLLLSDYPEAVKQLITRWLPTASTYLRS